MGYRSTVAYKIVFDKAQSVVALGQSAVIYKGSDCLGGGIIDQIKN